MPKTIHSADALKGIFPALFTPLKANDPKGLHNSIDYDKAKLMIDDLIAQGVHGLVPVGTTGQSATLTHQHHVDFIKFTIDYTDNRVPIIAGAGSNCTRESIETIQKIQTTTGELSFLCVTGYYNNPPQEGLVRHFETLVAETGAKIVIYNVPGRTNSYLSPETIIRLAHNPKIIGLKQAVDFKSPGQYREDTLHIIQETKNLGFSVLTGEDDAFYDMLSMGGKGMISATSNIPEAASLFVKLYSKFLKGNTAEALKIQESCSDFITACFLRKNPIPLAAFFNSPVYLPLISLKDTENGEELFKQLLDTIELKAPTLKKYHS